MEETTTALGMVGSKDSLSHVRWSAIARAYELIEAAQDALDDSVLDSALSEANTNGWLDVEFLLRYASAAKASRHGQDWSPQIERLSDIAKLTRDPDQQAIVSASWAELFPEAIESTMVDQVRDVERGLAEAVVLLKTPNGLGIDKPTAYIACGLAYRARGLWEIEEEMLQVAAQALEVPLPAPLDRTQIPVRKVLQVNRQSATLEWACALYEIGDLEGAAQVVSRALAADVNRSDLPSEWPMDLDAVEYALTALGGGERRVPFEEAMQNAQRSGWPGARACVLLGEAVRAYALGDLSTAALLADLSREAQDGTLPNAVQLALFLAAHRPPVNESALLYGQTLARARWRSRLGQLASARAQVESARVAIENQWLAQRAYVDELTGLANRHAFTRHTDRMRGDAVDTPTAILLVDVDNFKNVNDNLGHPVGDEVLRVIGDLLRQAVRPNDLAARTGGDEFIVVLDGADADAAKIRGWQILEHVQRYGWEHVASGLEVSVSIGVAAGVASCVEQLIRQADERLYRVKHNGRAAVSD